MLVRGEISNSFITPATLLTILARVCLCETVCENICACRRVVDTTLFDIKELIRDTDFFGELVLRTHSRSRLITYG